MIIASQICKYIMAAVMTFYMIGSFFILRIQSPVKMKWAFVRQIILILIFHAFGFITIMMHEQRMEILAFYLVQVAFFLLYVFIFRNVYPNSSRVILSHMILFLALSFIILTRLNFDKALKQFLMAIAAGTMTLVVPKMFSKLRPATRFAYILGIFGLLLLIAVLAFSSKTYGANLSLDLGIFTFQPSEFVKISFVLLIAVLFREKKDLKVVLLTAVFALFHILILVWSTDLGGALIYAFAYLFMLYVATGRLFYLFGGLTAGAGAAAVAYKMFAHVRTRVAIFLDPWPLMDGKGSQVCNSLLGMATGGFWGTGLYAGSPSLIPVVEKDFIFSAIVEEMGGIVGICLLLICISCFLYFILVSSELYSRFYRILGVGLSVIYGIQVFLAIGGNIKFIPATGVTLPLVSYGGSSVFSTFILFSIMQELFIRNRNDARQRNDEEKESVPAETLRES